MARRRGRAFATTPSVPRVALIDANVFFSPRMRDLVMQLREHEVIRVHWTKAIEVEWTRNVIEKQAADSKLIEACLAGMRGATDGDWEVAGYEKYEKGFRCCRPQGSTCGCSRLQIVPRRLAGSAGCTRHEEHQRLSSKGIQHHGGDALLLGALSRASVREEPDLVSAAIELCRKKLRKPSYSKDDYLAMLLKNGCQSLARNDGRSVERCMPVARRRRLANLRLE